MTAAALCLALALTLSPMTAGTVEPVTSYGSGAGSCSAWHGWRTPPDTIKVLRIHHKGSSVPKRIEVWKLKRYLAAVMASGASGSRVRESAKVFAVMVKNWTLYQMAHTCRTWRGKHYSISDSEQFLRPGIRPWSHLPVRTLDIVRIMSPITLKKNGHRLRLGWSGDGGRCGQVVDGYHVGEDGVRDCAERLHMGWRGILRLYLSPRLTILGDWR